MEKVELLPVIGFKAEVINDGEACLLTLRFLRSAPPEGHTDAAVQGQCPRVALSPDWCRKLAARLVQAAELMDHARQQQASRPKH